MATARAERRTRRPPKGEIRAQSDIACVLHGSKVCAGAQLRAATLSRTSPLEEKLEVVKRRLRAASYTHKGEDLKLLFSFSDRNRGNSVRGGTLGA